MSLFRIETKVYILNNHLGVFEKQTNVPWV